MYILNVLTTTIAWAPEGYFINENKLSDYGINK